MSKDHLFKPGQSGNPAGRPKGSCNKSKLFKKLVEPRSEEIINQGLSLAMHGDEKVQARLMVFFLDRLLPAACKDSIIPEQIELNDGTLLEQANHIKNLVNDKHITPEQAQVLLSNLKITAEIKYKEDLEKEVEELKAELKAIKDKIKR